MSQDFMQKAPELMFLKHVFLLIIATSQQYVWCTPTVSPFLITKYPIIKIKKVKKICPLYSQLPFSRIIAFDLYPLLKNCTNL